MSKINFLKSIKKLEKVNTESCQEYKPRFVTEDQLKELYNLYHLARTALCGGPPPPSQYDRINYAAKWFNKANPSISITAAYKDLDSSINFRGY